jgi:hypothetical protein
VKLTACLGGAALLVAAGGGSQTRAYGDPQKSTSPQHFVCNRGYTQKQCDEEMVVLRNALAHYPTTELGEWTWVLVKSENWKLLLLAKRLDPRVPALTDPAAKVTFFEEALVAGASGRLSELMAVWHMGRANLLDLAIRHELGHALCADLNEARAERIARLLKQKMPVTCEGRGTALQGRID